WRSLPVEPGTRTTRCGRCRPWPCGHDRPSGQPSQSPGSTSRVDPLMNRLSAVAPSDSTSGERLLAVPDALGDFRHGARALRDLVLDLDVGRERPLLLLHQLQDLLERRPSHAPRYVPAIGGPVLQMQADDPVVILLEHRERRLSLGTGEVVPDV